MHPLWSLCLGLLCAGVGGEMFVRGAIGVARNLRITAAVIGVTVAAFSTSSPELAVGIESALKQKPEIAFGNVLGANLLNVGLVLGIVLCFGSLRINDPSVRRDFALAIAVPLLTLFLALDGTVSRADGVILLLVFGIWLSLTVWGALRYRSEHLNESEQDKLGGVAPYVWTAAGLVVLILAGGLIVEGAEYVGKALGWSPFVVGATLVAVGTTIPELATTVISRWHGEDDIGLGAILGSNIFNGLFIVGVAAVIHPIVIQQRQAMMGLLFGMVTVITVFPNPNKILSRRRGPILLVLYAMYISVTLGWR